MNAKVLTLFNPIIRREKVLVAVVMLGQASILAYSAWMDSPVCDEVGHLAAGVSHWQFGRFRLFHVNPPLVRLVATAAVSSRIEPDFEWKLYDETPGSRAEFEVGKRFVNSDPWKARVVLTVARCSCIPLVLLGGGIIWWWSRDLLGRGAAFAALLLWSSCPNVLAIGHLILPDVHAASAGVLAMFAFSRWVSRGTKTLAVVAGATLGLAIGSKSTWLILWGLWPALYAGVRFVSRYRHWPSAPPIVQLGMVLLVSMVLLNGLYLFDGTFMPLGDFQFVSHLCGGQPASLRNPAKAFSDTFFARLPVPLPQHFVLGIDHIAEEFERGAPSYLFGKWYPRGVWYYYLIGIAIKLPVATLTLVTLGILSLCQNMLVTIRRARLPITEEDPEHSTCGPPTRADDGTQPRTHLTNSLRERRVDWGIILSVAASLLFVVSSQTGFSHHLRYMWWWCQVSNARMRRQCLARMALGVW